MKEISIIVTFQEQRPQLEQLLSHLLSWHYDGEYEVIVIDKLHDKDTAEWLEMLEMRYPHLHHTFCPASARGIDIHKLALTLGAKAAFYDWLVFLPVDVELPDDDWLNKLQTCCGDEKDIVVGITDQVRRWNWFTSFRFRRKFSLFRPTSSVILCHRNSLLQGEHIKLSENQIVKLYNS